MGSATYFGGNDAQEEGHWVWEDGSDFGYTNWAYNEPNGNTSENCLEVNTADGYWVIFFFHHIIVEIIRISF